MSSRVAMVVLVLLGGAILTVDGCTRITIAPSCPTELRAGESGPVAANEENPGAIAAYFWEAIPAEAGTFANPSAKDTTFQAVLEGDIILRLTASDGLFQVIDQCTVRVRGVVDAAVSLNASPNPATTGDLVVLACVSVGQQEATELTIAQTAGADIDLDSLAPGAASFTATAAGVFTFECTGETADGALSLPSQVTITVREPAPANDNANGNQNGNVNSNTNANANENSSGNLNDNDNAAAVANDNTNENSRRPGGRPGRP